MAAQASFAEPSSSPVDQTNSRIEWSKSKETTWLGTKYLFAPVTVPIDVALKLYRNQDKANILKDDGSYVIGYVFLNVGLGRIHDAYLATEAGVFHESIDVAGKHVPKKILLIFSTEMHKKLPKYETMYLDYQTNPEVTKISAKNFNNLVDQLERLPQNGQFDRIDILAHGQPGGLRLGVGPFATKKHFDYIAKKGLNIAAPGAEVRLTSCMPAANRFCARTGDELLESVGRALIPKGGKVYGSTKPLVGAYVTTEEFLEFRRELERHWSGLGALIRPAQVTQVLSHAPWTSDLSDRPFAATEITISPQSDHDSVQGSCSSMFQKVLRRTIPFKRMKER